MPAERVLGFPAFVGVWARCPGAGRNEAPAALRRAGLLVSRLRCAVSQALRFGDSAPRLVSPPGLCARPQCTKSHPIINTAAVINATAPQPRKRVLRRTGSGPMTAGLPASNIIAAMIGTATTPLITALQ